MASRSVSVLLAAALSTSASCADGPPPCSAASPCDEGVCVVGRCRAPGESVVSVESLRVVLHAREVAVLSSRGAPADAHVTAFGSSGSGGVVVLLAFDADVTRKVDVDGAFLVLHPEVASPGPTGPVEIDVAPILGGWRGDRVSWARAPSLGLSIAEVLVPPARRAPVRIDVTELVRKERGVGHGIALVANGDDPIGARLVTLARSAEGPKLELYLKAP